MKANDKQTEVINTLIEALEFMKDSNDIDSPTHKTNFSGTLLNILLIDDVITLDELEFLSDEFNNIHTIITQIK